MEHEEEVKKRIVLSFYKTKQPLFIITTSGDWISGYLNDEPKDLTFSVLSWKTNQVITLHYSRIHIIKEYEGDLSRLPLPDYLKEVSK